MSKILIVGQHADDTLNSSVSKTVAAAKAIAAAGGGDIEVVILATDGSAVARQAAKLDGVTKVLQVDRAENSYPMAAILAPQLVALVQSGGYSHVLVPGNTFGKDLAPRVAAKLGVQQVSDIMAAHSATSFDRPIYAGNAILTVEAPAEPCIVATVRLASCIAVDESGSAPVEKISVEAELPTHTRFIKLEEQKSGRPDLQSAARVVSGGRALGSAENFKIIYDFATYPTTCRWGRPARSSRRSCISPSASQGRSSIWPALETRAPSSPSTRMRKRRSSRWRITGWWGICFRSFPR